MIFSDLLPPVPIPSTITEIKDKMQALKDEYCTLPADHSFERGWSLFLKYQELEGTLITLRGWQFQKAAKELITASHSPDHVSRMLRHIACGLVSQLYPELEPHEVEVLLDTLVDPLTNPTTATVALPTDA